jgi:hypothetical protein
MILPLPESSYNGSQPLPAVVGAAIALTPAVSRSIEGYAGCPELPSGLGCDSARLGSLSRPAKEESAVGLPKRVIRHGQKRVTKRLSGGTVTDRSILLKNY